MRKGDDLWLGYEDSSLLWIQLWISRQNQRCRRVELSPPTYLTETAAILTLSFPLLWSFSTSWSLWVVQFLLETAHFPGEFGYLNRFFMGNSGMMLQSLQLNHSFFLKKKSVWTYVYLQSKIKIWMGGIWAFYLWSGGMRAMFCSTTVTAKLESRLLFFFCLCFLQPVFEDEQQWRYLRANLKLFLRIWGLNMVAVWKSP